MYLQKIGHMANKKHIGGASFEKQSWRQIFIQKQDSIITVQLNYDL